MMNNAQAELDKNARRCKELLRVAKKQINAGKINDGMLYLLSEIEERIGFIHESKREDIKTATDDCKIEVMGAKEVKESDGKRIYLF